MAERFSLLLRRDARPIWWRIFAHPFVRELGAGILARRRFAFFIRQDARYLQDFARVLCLGGAKAADLETLEMFARHAHVTVEVEGALHVSFARRLGLTPRELRAAPAAPVTQAYTRHLLTVGAQGTLGELVAALLPCYWIYWEVGKRLARRLPRDPLYAEWIRSYAAEAFGELVREQLDLADRLGAEASRPERARMRAHFLLGSRYEYLFWEQAYRQRGWPA